MVHVSAGGDSPGRVLAAKFHYSVLAAETSDPAGRHGREPRNTIQDQTLGRICSFPAHPEYPSGHAWLHRGRDPGAEQSYFGTDRVPWAMTSTVTGTTHSLRPALSQIRAEVANARVWGGLHFRKSTERRRPARKADHPLRPRPQLPPITRPLTRSESRPCEPPPAGPRAHVNIRDVELIHTCYRITDIDRSVAFYEALGFEERGRCRSATRPSTSSWACPATATGSS